MTICEECNSIDIVENEDIYCCFDCEKVFSKHQDCCSKPEIIFIQLENSNNIYHQRQACKNCKNIFPKAFTRDSNFNTYLKVNLRLKKIWTGIQDFKRENKYEFIEDFRKQIQDKKNKEWWDKYNLHLNSQYWHNIRKKIIHRDKICQGCLENPIQEIHHKSYVNFEQEFCFELIGLCKQCHERYHNKTFGK